MGSASEMLGLKVCGTATAAAATTAATTALFSLPPSTPPVRFIHFDHVMHSPGPELGHCVHSCLYPQEASGSSEVPESIVELKTLRLVFPLGRE